MRAFRFTFRLNPTSCSDIGGFTRCGGLAPFGRGGIVEKCVPKEVSDE